VRWRQRGQWRCGPNGSRCLLAAAMLARRWRAPRFVSGNQPILILGDVLEAVGRASPGPRTRWPRAADLAWRSLQPGGCCLAPGCSCPASACPCFRSVWPPWLMATSFRVHGGVAQRPCPGMVAGLTPPRQGVLVLRRSPAVAVDVADSSCLRQWLPASGVCWPPAPAVDQP